MRIEHAFIIDLPRERAWSLITAPATVAACVPGCHGVEVLSPTRCKAAGRRRHRPDPGPIRVDAEDEAMDDFAILRRRPMAGADEVTRFGATDTVALELAAFTAACRGEAPLPVTPAEAVHNVAVMEAMVGSVGKAGAGIEVAA